MMGDSIDFSVRFSLYLPFYGRLFKPRRVLGSVFIEFRQLTRNSNILITFGCFARNFIPLIDISLHQTISGRQVLPMHGQHVSLFVSCVD